MILKTHSLSSYGRIFTTALIAVLGLGASQTAAAQHVEGTPYYQSAICYSATTNQCTAVFPTVPAKKMLVVKYIASNVDTATPLSVAEFDVNGQIFIPILHTLQGPDPGGYSIYVASQPMIYFFTAGQSPNFLMFSQAGPVEFMSGQVTLTGYLVDAKE